MIYVHVRYAYIVWLYVCVMWGMSYVHITRSYSMSCVYVLINCSVHTTFHDTTFRGIPWHYFHDTSLHDVAFHNSTLHDTTWHYTPWNSTRRYSTIFHDTTLIDTTFIDTIVRVILRHDISWHSTTRYCMTFHDIPWYDILQHYMT